MSGRVLRPRATKQAPAGTPKLGEPQQLSSPPTTPAPAKRARGKVNASEKVVQTPSADTITSNTSRKRARKAAKVEDDPYELPHNLGRLVPPTPVADDDDEELQVDDGSPKKRPRTRKPAKPVIPSTTDAEVQALAAKVGLTAPTTSSASPSKKSKAKEHALQPGISPYPTYPHPTAEECHEVTRVLSKLHGEVAPPAQIPMPSLTVAGCGEVPSVLDALVRTRLSANTSNNNSSRAFQGIVQRFGVKESGIGKGSVDWDKVRRSNVNDLEESIRAGGLSKIKSKDIKQILDLVYEENQARAAALRDPENDPKGAERESEGEKNVEVAKAEEGVLSLDHLHLLGDEEAFRKLVSYPGIGPKTASCVMLFCMKRASFAVDTHVFRLCRWLGWVPSQEVKGMPKVDRETCFHHCEARVPGELKYPLHQLLIKHGRTCPRCRAITGEASKDWDKGCVIEKLVKRDGVKKASGKMKVESEEDEAEEWEEDDADD
ncbi:DNA glycosylase [Rhizodiscina lignyota]|uniref:DNA glycosylase n=1 Tax=Rhizodiscina lignyota TaxID=1504668 RepID=A0A9P4M8A6_9PEZI|nr:DNA glycosylase [Rhizodiscina lignyota]